MGLDLKIYEVVYSNLGDCRVCPIARHRSSWAGWSVGWSGHSRAGHRELRTEGHQQHEPASWEVESQSKHPLVLQNCQDAAEKNSEL